jgi:hypothetical protein
LEVRNPPSLLQSGTPSAELPELQWMVKAGLACVRILLEQNDEWAVQRRCMSLETLGSLSDTARSACPPWQPTPQPTLLRDHSYTT